MKISHPGPTDHNPKGAVPHTRHSPLLLNAHQHTARAPRPPERSPPEGNAPNGDKHSKACRQLGTYDEQLGTYVEQLGTWKIPSAELFLRSGEQSRAMRARKYRTPSVYRKFKGGLEATPSQSGSFRSARCQTCCQANLKRRCTGRAWLPARRCQACCSTSGHNEAFKGGHNEAFNERAESPTST